MSKDLIPCISEQEFDRLTFESTIPALVLFGAERCTVCKELLPTVEEIAADYAGQVNVYWVDVDQYKSLFKRFRLKGIPHLALFSSGEVKKRMGGLRSREELVEIIEMVLETAE